MNLSSRYQFAGAFGGQVTLSFNPAEAVKPGFVLIVPWYKGKLLLTKHIRRGWEMPGGTIEPGEMPLAAAIRETFEETGAELDAIEWIGQYVIVGERPEPMVKDVYIARVKHLHPLPEGFETEDVRVCEEIPDPQKVQEDSSYSPIMRDAVYPLVLKRIQDMSHPFLEPRG